MRDSRREDLQGEEEAREVCPGFDEAQIAGGPYCAAVVRVIRSVVCRPPVFAFPQSSWARWHALLFVVGEHDPILCALRSRSTWPRKSRRRRPRSGRSWMRWSPTRGVASAIWRHTAKPTCAQGSVPAAVVLVDTGPLVALLDPSDRARERCRSYLDQLNRAELVTTEAVITEAEYLLDFSVQAQETLMHLLATGKPRVEPIATTDRTRIAGLMNRYANLPMDYADATLVVIAERLSAPRIFTLDRRDFGVYRVGRRRFEIVP